jgi:hypothetical protein
MAEASATAWDNLTIAFDGNLEELGGEIERAVQPSALGGESAHSGTLSFDLNPWQWRVTAKSCRFPLHLNSSFSGHKTTENSSD